MKSKLYAGIETGYKWCKRFFRGTTCKVAIGEGTYTNIIDKITIETRDPAETIGKIVDWLAGKNIESVGVAAFGPLCLNPKDPK